MQTSPKLGNYEIDLGNPDLQKCIAQATFRQSLDAYSVLTVAVARTATDMEKWKASDSPKEARFSWNGKVIFKGHLLSVESEGHSRFQLRYVDNLYFATKASGNQFVKQQTLRDCLQKLVSGSELQAQFQGSFSEVLSGFQQGGASVFDVVATLSNKHGFHFATRAGTQLTFLKSGKGMTSVTLDVKENASAVFFKQSTEGSFEKVHVRYFDPKTVEAKDTTLPSGQLYGPLSTFTGSSSFSEKSGWKTAKGTLEANMTDRHHFQNGQTYLADQFSKRALEQEAIQITCFDPTALPGDILQIAGAPVPAIQNGSYLVAAVDISVRSALPRLTLTAMRA